MSHMPGFLARVFPARYYFKEAFFGGQSGTACEISACLLGRHKNSSRMFSLRSSVVTLSLLLLFAACKSDPESQEHLALKELPFGADRAATEGFFEQKGWKVLNQDDNRISFFFPAAVPEELRNLPVMGEEAAPEPYTVQVFFNPEGKAAVMILHRYDTTERLEGFFQTLRKNYGLENLELSQKRETSKLGNELIESKGAVDTGDTVFLVLRSRVLPVEERLKNGMNDEVEVRIFPKDLNEGITPEALLD